MKDILEYWPFPEFEPREIQKTALQWLQEQESRYLLLEAPVGSGKSAIGLCYSAWLHNHRFDALEEIEDAPPLPEEDGDFFGSSFILTPQRMLQEQYENSVKDNEKINMASLYGRSNYTCSDHSTTCDIGKEIKPKCPNCPCNAARERAKTSKEVVLNYALALNSFAFTDSFTPRKLMILDECHNVEQLLVQFGTLSISKGRCDKYKLPFKVEDNIRDSYKWSREVYIPKLATHVLDMKEEYDFLKDSLRDLTTKEKKFIKEYLALAKHYSYAKKLLNMDYGDFHKEFVYTKEKTNIEFKRLYGREPFSNILDPMADRFLFMSSTILDKKGFCDDLGLDPRDTSFLSLQSEFPIKNRKVMYMPQMKMNAKWKDAKQSSGRQKMIDTVNAICEMNEDNSGIIHTANFQIAQWLVDEIKIPQRIFHHNPGKYRVDRNTVINNFQDSSTPSLLISPSSTEGLDLKDDLGRFAIFCKVPFGYLGDEWIKSRMNISGDWYKRQALIDVIQGGGRVVRTETDWGTVFILDESWAFLFRTTHTMIPKWWKSAYFDKSR